MGNACGACAGDKDENELYIRGPSGGKGMPDGNQNFREEEFYVENHRSIVKIQSAFRAQKARSYVKQGKHLERKFVNDPALEYKQEFQFDDGAVYTGQMLNGQREGYGIQIWPEGAKYEGFWKDNMAHGRGKFHHLDGDIYDGEWERDMANGFGTYFRADGSQYQGEWLNDKQHGHGIELWSDNSKYEGFYA